MHAANREKICAFVVRAVYHGHPEIRPKEQVRTMKRGGNNSNHRKRVLVHVDGGPKDAGVRIEMSAPKVMAQDDVRGGIRSVFFARVKKPAMLRPNAQHVEVIPGNSVVPAFVGGVFRAKPRALDPVSRHIAEGRILALKIQVVGIGLIVVSRRFLHHVVKRGGLGHVEGPQHQSIHRAEHHDIRTDSQNQCQERGGRECRRPLQLARGVAQVAPDGIQSRCRVRSRYAFPHHNSTAETNQSIATSFFGRHSGGKVVGNAHFDMRLDFRIDFLMQFRAREGVYKPAKDRHESPHAYRRMARIPWTSCSKLSSAFRSSFCPASVSR